MAEKYPDIVRRIEAEGHIVGQHSYSHPDPMQTPTLEMHREVRAANRVLREILGHPVRLYRPPHGKVRPADLPLIWLLHHTIVLWNVAQRAIACCQRCVCMLVIRCMNVESSPSSLGQRMKCQ